MMVSVYLKLNEDVINLKVHCMTENDLQKKINAVIRNT